MVYLIAFVVLCAFLYFVGISIYCIARKIDGGDEFDIESLNAAGCTAIGCGLVIVAAVTAVVLVYSLANY